MRRYFRILGVQLRFGLVTAMSYRANFFLEGVVGVTYSALTLLPLVVVYRAHESFNGWDFSSALVVMSYFIALQALLEGIISPSLAGLIGRIHDGSFDYVLLMPADAQAIVSASRLEPWKIFDLLFAVALAVYAFHFRGAPPSCGELLLGFILFIAAIVTMYSFWITCAALAFWGGRVDNLMYLLTAIFDAGRWPVAVFPLAWRIVFTFVVPLALMTTFPAMALTGALGGWQAAETIAGAVLMFSLSRCVWRKAIRSYTSASG